jgi:uncharacterized membrane protein YhaH (DUF805 family)
MVLNILVSFWNNGAVRLFDLLLNPSGRVNRRQFLAAGVVLAAIKLTIDYFVTTAVFSGGWRPWEYVWAKSPLVALSEGRNLEQYFTLLLIAAPFAWVGVCLCCKRLRSAGRPLWLALFFFVPIAKWFLFAILATVPEREVEPTPGPSIPTGSWTAWVGATAFRSAAVACLITTSLGLLLLWVSVYFLRAYGSTLFLATPFVLGMLTCVLHGAAKPRKLEESILASLLALLIIGVCLLTLASEGAICLAMAAPIAVMSNILGCLVAYTFLAARERRGRHIGLSALAVLPLLFFAEQHQPAEREIQAVTTSVTIDADRATVWKNVVAFSEIPPPRELIFRAGIAYPLRARIDGTGVGATRHCVFSTGAFVEPITVWNDPDLLAFNVTAQPDPLTELSPYGRIDAPHLHGYFNSQRGEFRLTALPGGRTLLTGTTWYVNHIEPNAYWRLWTDYLVHKIHRRVLDHIKADAER